MMSTDKNAPESYKKRKLIGWKAWYTNGESFCSCKYKWEDIPQRHFAFLKRFYVEIDEKENQIGEPYAEMWSGQDVYIISDEYRDKLELIQKDFKIGEWMKDEDFHPLYDKARDENKIIVEMI